MSIADDIKESVRSYINRQNTVRAELKTTLGSIVSALPETVIFGGMIRDFALGDARHFFSDIDLVTLGSKGDIEKAIAKYNPKQNKFGGFRFVANKQVYDLWAFEDTWAFRQGYVEGHKLEDLLKTTFFNVDASAYSLTSDCIYISEECLKAIEDRVLDINLTANPAPQRMVKRAIRYGLEKDFAIGPRLAEYMVKRINLHHLNRMDCLFMLGLKDHVERDYKHPYTFSPQPSLL